jgi:hypothetical protein
VARARVACLVFLRAYLNATDRKPSCCDLICETRQDSVDAGV